MTARAAIVTGASSGIGRAIAGAFGALGWSVALGARRAERLTDVAADVAAAGGRPFAHALDVGDPASVDTFYDAASAALGPPDVLVNNAGTAWPGDVAEVDPAHLEEIVRTNLLGAILVSRRVVAALLEADRPGDVVMISSDVVHNPRPGLLAYGATKAAVEYVARGLAYEVEGHRVRVTTVRVGPTLTEFAAEWGDPEHFAGLVRRWQRFGSQRHAGVLEPAHVAAVVVAAVIAPAGVHHAEVEVMPEPPAAPSPSGLG